MTYLDNAATSIKDTDAIKAEADFYKKINANPLRGLYKKCIQAETGVNEARNAVLKLVGAGKSYTVIFLRNATEALNLVANGLLKGGDGFGVVEKDAKIVVDIESHHSNILPWKQRYKNVVISTDLDKDLDGAEIVSLTGVSNVTGENFSRRIKDARRKLPEAILGVDGAQMIGHAKINLDSLGVDYIAFSGHKFGAPMGVGGLVIKKELAEKIRPLNYGGEMVMSVSKNGEPIYAEVPQRLEAGTLPVGAIFGLKKAAENASRGFNPYQEGCIIYPSDVEKIQKTVAMTADAMKKIRGVKVLAANGSILTFQIEDIHPHDIAQMLADENIAVRAGWLCAEPYLRYKSWGPVIRASYSAQNCGEIAMVDEKLVQAVSRIRRKMGLV